MAKLVYFGTDDFSVAPLEGLIAGGFDVAAVVTKPDARVGRGRELAAPALKLIARQHDITVYQPTKLSEIQANLAALKADIGIVVAYGKIIPQGIIDLFPHGIINIHGSLLPRYRGSSPIEAAILNGDGETGVSLMQIDAGMDTGAVFAQSKVSLSGQETRPKLYEVLSRLGATLLIESLPQILDGRLQAKRQPKTGASLVSRLSKADGGIDWSKPTVELERHVRAYLGWPGSRTTIDGVEVTITGAQVGSAVPGPPGMPQRTSDGHLAVATSDGSLIITELTPAGKRNMTSQSFLAGHPLPH